MREHSLYSCYHVGLQSSFCCSCCPWAPSMQCLMTKARIKGFACCLWNIYSSAFLQMSHLCVARSMSCVSDLLKIIQLGGWEQCNATVSLVPFLSLRACPIYRFRGTSTPPQHVSSWDASKALCISMPKGPDSSGCSQFIHPKAECICGFEAHVKDTW